jgi:hypothetical protein
MPAQHLAVKAYFWSFSGLPRERSFTCPAGTTMDSIFVPPQFGHVFVPIGIGSLQFAQTMMTSVE